MIRGFLFIVLGALTLYCKAPSDAISPSQENNPVFIKFKDDFDNNLVSVKINGKVLFEKVPFLRSHTSKGGLYEKSIKITDSEASYYSKGVAQETITIDEIGTTINLELSIDDDTKTLQPIIAHGNYILISYSDGQIEIKQSTWPPKR